MNPFAIVCDSAADLPELVVQHRDVRVVALDVRGGDASLTEERTEGRGALRAPLPAPASSAFFKTYSALIDEGYREILSLHVAAELSRTYLMASAAARALESSRARILAVDTRSVAIGEAVAVVEAALAREQGASMDEAAQRAVQVGSTGVLQFIPASAGSLMRAMPTSRAERLSAAIFGANMVAEARLDGQGAFRVEPPRKASSMKHACALIARRLARRSQNDGPLAFVTMGSDEMALRALRKPLETNELEATDAGVLPLGPCALRSFGSATVGVFSWPETYHNPKVDTLIATLADRMRA